MSKEQNKFGHLIDDATKTPRTQAAIKTYGDYIRSEDAVSIEFAEQLETELAEARAEIERLEKAVKVVQSAFNNYKNADAEIAKIEMREAKIEMREAKILAASCNFDSVNSERAANAILTDEIERKDKLIEQMREALQRVASQMLTWEMDEEEREHADGCYEDAYQIIIREARAALRAAERGE